MNTNKMLKNLTLIITKTTNKIDLQIKEAGNKSLKLGKRLEETNNKKEKTKELLTIIQCLEELDFGSCSVIEELLSMSTLDSKREIAKIVKKLQEIFKEVDIKEAEIAKQTVNKYSNNIENDLLIEFEESYKSKDIETLKRSTEILFEFNGGNSCIQTFINQHELCSLSKKNSYHEIDQQNNVYEKLNSYYDLNTNEVKLSVNDLIRNIYLKTVEEWDLVIKKVFPLPMYVLNLLIERVFAQSLQPNLEKCLDLAQANSVLSYLRVLFIIFDLMKHLTAKFKKLEQTKISRELKRNELVNHGFGNKRDSLAQNTDASNVVPLYVVVDRCFDDLFLPYIDNEFYVGLEKKLVKQLTEELFNPILSETTKKYKSKNYGTMFAKISDKISSPGLSISSKSKGFPFLNTNKETSIPSTPTNTENVQEHKELFQDIRNAFAKILNLQKETAARIVELSPRNVHQNIIVFSNTLCSYFGEDFLKVVIEFFKKEARTEPKLEPNYSLTFDMIDCVCEVLQLVEDFFDQHVTVIFKLVPTTYRELNLIKNSFVAAVRERTESLASEELSRAVSHISYILSSQKKTEFLPGDDDDLELLSIATEQCTKCVDFINGIFNSIKTRDDSSLFDPFVTAFGIAMHEYLNSK